MSATGAFFALLIGFACMWFGMKLTNHRRHQTIGWLLAGLGSVLVLVCVGWRLNSTTAANSGEASEASLLFNASDMQVNDTMRCTGIVIGAPKSLGDSGIFRIMVKTNDLGNANQSAEMGAFIAQDVALGDAVVCNFYARYDDFGRSDDTWIAEKIEE